MWVIPDLLRGAAQAINGAAAAIGGAATPATALPPAPDTASLAAIARLNMYAQGLSNALTEGSQRLGYLDGKLKSDASLYESADSANAQAIAASVGLSGVGGDLISTGGGGAAAPMPMAPAATSATSPGGMPAIPPLAVPGEAFAAMLDAAPGSTSLSTYLSTLQGVMSTLEFSNPLVDRGRGMVTEGWNSGDSGSNPAEAATAAIARMTQWGTEATGYTTALQNAANEMASAFETLRVSHPTTAEYTAAHAQIQSGITGMQAGAASLNPAMFVAGALNVQQGTAAKAALDARAVQTQSTYTARLETATNVATPLPKVASSDPAVVAPGYGQGSGGSSGWPGDVSSYERGPAYDYSNGTSSDGGAYSGGSNGSYGSGGQGSSGANAGQGMPGQGMGQGYGQGSGSGLGDYGSGSGTGSDGYADGGAGYGGGYAPGAFGGALGGAAGAGAGASSLGANNGSGNGRLIGQSSVAAPATTTNSGTGLNNAGPKIGAVPAATGKGGMGMGPMMPPMGRTGTGSGDEEKARDKALAPDITIEDDTPFHDPVLGTRPRIRGVSLRPEIPTERSA